MTNLKEATDKLNAFHLAAHAIAKLCLAEKSTWNGTSRPELTKLVTDYARAEAACGAAIFGEKP